MTRPCGIGRYRIAIRLLVSIVACFAAIASGFGIFYRSGTGPFEHESIRGQVITTHGNGLYQHMSAEVAPQGIAQDVVTLFVGIPLLLLGLRWANTGSLRGRFLLAGVAGYFFVTYLFYLVMAMYNAMFLAYVILCSCSFFALALLLLGFDVAALPQMFGRNMPRPAAGVFLMMSAGLIALLWLSIVVPPLFTGLIIPPEVEHYTTLVVQGLDLSLLLPLSFLSGWLFLKGIPLGFLLAPIYLVFLALLMMALTAKVVAMGVLGYSVMPAIIIIPILTAASASFAIALLKAVEQPRRS